MTPEQLAQWYEKLCADMSTLRAENKLLLDQRDTCWESHKDYEAENERLRAALESIRDLVGEVTVARGIARLALEDK